MRTTRHTYTDKPTMYHGRPGGQYDTNHDITDIGLKGGALLHRFFVFAPDHNDTGADPVPYSAIYVNGVEVVNNPRTEENSLIAYWNKYGADEWERLKAEDEERQKTETKYNKVPGCIYTYKYGCKGCEHNIDPLLFDGGCKIMYPRREYENQGATV